MREEILQALSPIIGLPLTDMWRYLGHQKFEFGEQRPHKNRKGEDVTWADWGLVVACDWRITGAEGTIVSSDDFGPGNNRRDESAHPFYHMLGESSPIVEVIEAEEDGRVRIHMTDGYILDVLPEEVPDEEQWRFMPKDKRRRHFVVTREGIQK